MDQIYAKRIILEAKHDKLTSFFSATCRNSVVDFFKNKCMKFFLKQLDDKSVRAYNTLINTGKRFY